MKESDFRAWIVPVPEGESEGKWDYRVRVQRLKDGAEVREKVSGGWIVAEAVAGRLMRELGMQDNPPQPGESPVENIRNALQLLSAEQGVHLDEVKIVRDVRARLHAALQQLENPPRHYGDTLKGNPDTVHIDAGHVEVNPSRYSPAAREFLSAEIPHLIRDKGYTLDRAVGAAMRIARKKRLKVPPPLRRNPLGAVLTLVNAHGERVPMEDADHGQLMATGVHSIAYRHASDGKDYEHTFKRWSRVGIKVLDEHRALLFSSEVPIIQMFEVED